jgi:CheY-like chemotaxis protein
MAEMETVLLVDDDLDILRGTEFRLRAAGYATLTAHDGEQCVTTANEQLPDAIVLDVHMPGKDGLQALAELKKNEETRKIAVVMLSASVLDHRAALEAGASFFVKKPYRSATLVAAVDAAINLQPVSVTCRSTCR